MIDAEIYFPAFHSEAECHKCELEDCPSWGKYQRNNRAFSYASWRCPKLPDVRGFVDKSQRENQRKAYPFVHAESNGEEVFLSLSLPGIKKPLRVYETRSGYFYFKTKDEQGEPIKRVIWIGGNMSLEDIKNFMERRKADYCIFNCEIFDQIV